MNVAATADYGCPRSVIMPSAQLDSFAQRILVREYLASGPFADECHVLVSRGVGLGKRAAMQQWDSHGVKVARARDIAVHGRNFRIGNAAILNDKTSLIETAEASGNRTRPDQRGLIPPRHK